MMDYAAIGALGFFVALALLLLRVPIGFTLVAVGTGCTLVAYSSRQGLPFDLARGINPTLGLIEAHGFEFVHAYSLSMIPLFILTGHVAYHARITTDIYDAVRVWLARLPGGLAIASLIGCAGFSAITGSSLACASSMGRICVPEMLKQGYAPRLATAAVAAGGTLGSLIPPSVLFIMYGLFTETSISKLFMAGIGPGLLSLAGFIATVMIWTWLRPSIAPRAQTVFSRAERAEALLRAWPAAVLVALVVGGIYTGVFTATEAAAVSMVFVVGFGFLSRRLSLAAFLDSARETAVQSAALFFIAVGAKIFVSFVSLTGVTRALVDLVAHAGMPDWMVLVCIVALYLAMGMFLDPLGTILLTLPFVVPLVESMGLDLIWFGVIVVKLLEIGLITPPVGLNVFVIGSVTGPEVKIHAIFAGVSRFLIMELVVLDLLLAFPALSLFIPNQAF